MYKKIKTILVEQRGMELVQVAVLVAIAIVIGLIFKDQIMSFVNNVFSELTKAKFPV